MSFLDYLMNGTRQRKEQREPEAYIPPGMPIDIATSRSPTMTPNLVQDYNLPPLPPELSRRPMAPQMTTGGMGQPWAGQTAPNGISPSPAPNFVGEGTSAPWMGSFPSRPPSAGASEGASSGGGRQSPGAPSTTGSTGGALPWEPYRIEDENGRPFQAFGTRAAGTGDRSQVAWDAPGMGFLKFMAGLDSPRPAASTPASVSSLQGPTQAPGAPSLDQVAGQPAASPSLIDNFGNTPLGSLFKAWGIGL
jgi:hypothetical protein